VSRARKVGSTDCTELSGANLTRIIADAKILFVVIENNTLSFLIWSVFT